MNRTAAFVLAVVAISANPSAQIPEEAKWEITFRQVEAAVGLSNMRNVSSQSFEARLMERPWSDTQVPLPFLRVFRSEGSMRAELYVFWTPRTLLSNRQPSGEGIECRDGFCVKQIPLNAERDWEMVVSDLALHDACPRDRRSVVVCGDCQEIWIKTAVDGNYREQACQLLTPDKLARSLLELMQTSAQAAR